MTEPRGTDQPPEVDPAASLAIWSIEVALGGKMFTIPPLPASDWLPALMTGDPTRVFPGLVEDSDELDMMLVEGTVGPEEVAEAAADAIEQAAGRRMWPALVLANVARKQWSIIGSELAKSGIVRFDQIPLGSALDAIYGVAVSRLGDEGRQRFHRLLNGSGGRPQTRQDRESALNQFAQFAGPPPVQSTAAPSSGERPRTRPRRPERRPGERSPSPTRPRDEHARSDHHPTNDHDA